MKIDLTKLKEYGELKDGVLHLSLEPISKLIDFQINKDESGSIIGFALKGKEIDAYEAQRILIAIRDGYITEDAIICDNVLIKYELMKKVIANKLNEVHG